MDKIAIEQAQRKNKREQEIQLINHLKSIGGWNVILHPMLKRERRGSKANLKVALGFDNVEKIGKVFIENQAILGLIERIYIKLGINPDEEKQNGETDA